jgi:hypothetical protein
LHDWWQVAGGDDWGSSEGQSGEILGRRIERNGKSRDGRRRFLIRSEDN